MTSRIVSGIWNDASIAGNLSNGCMITSIFRLVNDNNSARIQSKLQSGLSPIGDSPHLAI